MPLLCVAEIPEHNRHTFSIYQWYADYRTPGKPELLGSEKPYESHTIPADSVLILLQEQDSRSMSLLISTHYLKYSPAQVLYMRINY